MPIINSAFKTLQKEILSVVMLLMFILFSIIPLFIRDTFYVGYGYSGIWLVFLYCCGGYLKKFSVTEKRSALFLLGFFISTVVAFIIDIMRDRVSEGYILDLLNGLFKYNSPVVLLQAICLLYVFKSLIFNDFWKKLTLGIAPLSFGVYIIHGHKILFWALIVEKWNWLTGCSVYKQLFVSLGVSLLIFGMCLAIDWVRYRIFEVLKVRELLSRLDRL